MRITDVVDNRAGEGLVAEHGLALWIEHGDERILFDTGAGTALEPNARRLGIELGGLSRVVLSHSHYDHTGGLGGFCSGRPVHVGGGIGAPSFSRQPDKPMHELGMPAAARTALATGAVQVTRDVARIAEGVRLFGPIPRVDALEHVRGFFYDAACTMPSRVPEEQALLTDDGVLVTGCCHAGIVNTVACVRARAPEVRIRAIVGGLHLCWASADQVARAAAFLDGLGLERLVLLHCTGEAACAHLAERVRCPVSVGRSGQTWSF